MVILRVIYSLETLNYPELTLAALSLLEAEALKLVS